MFTEKQEQVFSKINTIIDSEISLEMPLDKYIRSVESFRKACERAFGGVKEALDSYGYYTEDIIEYTDEQVIDFVLPCFRVAGFGEVLIDSELLNQKLQYINAFTSKYTERLVIKIVTKYLTHDRIEHYALTFGEIGVSAFYFRPSFSVARQIEKLICNEYGTIESYRKVYGIDMRLLDIPIVKVNARRFLDLGSEFEQLSYATLSTLYKPIIYQKKVADCIPDFIIGDCWYDAKLSRSTALNPRCETIEKYRKHTDYLTIIYAIDDTTATDDRATFVHITEYYPYISAELQREIDAFIRKATEVKFGESNRLSDVQVRNDSAKFSA